ncbi:MAG: anti-sigma factor family protein [Halothece sp.]
MKNPDHFELLSAYLDRELTPEENEKVEQWLNKDPQAQKNYQHLLQLRYHLQKAPIPSSSFSAEQLTEQVVTQSQQQTWQQVNFWGKRALVAVLIAFTSSTLAWTTSPSFRLANLSPSEEAPNSNLMISVDQPIIDIPATPQSPSSEY